MLLVTQKKVDDIVLIMLSGSINVNSHDDLHNSIVECPEGHGENILLSLECLDRISSSGIGILVTACMEIQKQGRIIKLVEVPTDILEKLDLHKVLPVFNIFSDVESAAKQIKIDVEEKGEAFVRLFERIEVKLNAKFRVHKKSKKTFSAGFQNSMATNLTKRGMFITTDDPLSADTLIDVKLSFGKSFFKKESVSFLGKVVRRLEAADGVPAGVGLIILHMDAKEMERLDNFLKKQ
ncbi:MAG: STAS domain-containing protein [Thermodesulfobacteriota bacterium]